MRVLILGTRGVPATHGGFETFAEDLSQFLRSRNHDVTVYCQVDSKAEAGEDAWNGVRRVFIPAGEGPFGTITFDWDATWHSFFEKDSVVLTLGYNTGVFNFLYRLRGIPNVMNMDGLEWQRRKWSPMQRAWLWFNEWAGARAATHLVADHPEIGVHLLRHTPRKKITVIPYGARTVRSGSLGSVRRYGLSHKDYYLVIARPEPENSVLEIVRAYSRRSSATRLVVLGTYLPEENDYHRRVIEAAGPGVLFLGSIYDHRTVESLRFHARAYLHGHTVGGTNPSLVESLAAGAAIIAHDNRFNRWVAGPDARYFSGVDDLAGILESLEAQPGQLSAMEAASRRRHHEHFKQEDVLSAYEKLLFKAAGRQGPVRVPEPASRGGVYASHVRSGTEG